MLAVSAFFIWGLVPVYYKWIDHVSPSEVLAHRILWSTLLLGIGIAILRQWRTCLLAIRSHYQLLFLTSFLVSLNWFVFIWAVGQERILETSLGYFINPLVSVLLGMLVLKERLRAGQWVAIALATIGVFNQVLFIGQFPWIALILAFSFGFYGLLRKQLPVNAVHGLFAETLLMLPFASAYLFWLMHQGRLQFGQLLWPDDILIAAAGLVTIVPLLLFVAASKRLTLTTVGITQYIAPSMSFVLAIFVFNEPFESAQMITFACIWSGLLIFTLEGLTQTRVASQQ